MADFTNKQLAEIISQVSEDIKSSVLKQRKITNELNGTNSNLAQKTLELEHKIKTLQAISIKPDLSDLNNFYKEKTEKNIKTVNSRLKVPNLAIYIWLSSVGLFFLSGLFLWLSVKSKRDIISEYQSSLLKENAIITKENKKLFDDMLDWFNQNPRNKESFIKQRNK